MSDRLDSILRKSRHILTDTQGSRYSDVVLLDHMDDAQKQIVSDTHLLTARSNIPLVNGVSLYTAPDNCLRLLRVSIDGKKVDRVTTIEMDESGPWEDKTGSDVKLVLFDDNMPFQFRVYPKPDSNVKSSINLLYNNLPSTIVDIESKLEIPTMFDHLLVHFIVYKAFYSNADSANREMAAGQFSLYNDFLKRIIASSSFNFTPATDIDTTYNNLI